MYNSTKWEKGNPLFLVKIIHYHELVGKNSTIEEQYGQFKRNVFLKNLHFLFILIVRAFSNTSHLAWSMLQKKQ